MAGHRARKHTFWNMFGHKTKLLKPFRELRKVATSTNLSAPPASPLLQCSCWQNKSYYIQLHTMGEWCSTFGMCTISVSCASGKVCKKKKRLVNEKVAISNYPFIPYSYFNNLDWHPVNHLNRKYNGSNIGYNIRHNLTPQCICFSYSNV